MAVNEIGVIGIPIATAMLIGPFDSEIGLSGNARLEIVRLILLIHICCFGIGAVSDIVSSSIVVLWVKKTISISSIIIFFVQPIVWSARVMKVDITKDSI